MLGIIKHNDGTVSIVAFNVSFGNDNAAKLAHLQTLSKDGDIVDLISPEQLPDRYFREAWNHDLGIDLPKARNVHLDRLRKERDEKLQASDAKILVAKEQGDVQKEDTLKVKRQALRDMPTVAAPALEALTDPAQIKIYRPAILDEVL